MKTAFICRSFESLGVEYICAVLKRSGMSVDLIYDPALFDSLFFTQTMFRKAFSYHRRLLRRAAASRPDIIAFSVSSEDYGWALRTAFDLKKAFPEIITVFGGTHPTIVPEAVAGISWVDYVCVGEGEYAFLDLVTALNSGADTRNIANIWSKDADTLRANAPRPLIDDLDSLPWADKELFHHAYRGFSRDYYNIITSRGCVCECSFCYPGVYKKLYQGKGVFYRRRSVDNVIDELQAAKRIYDSRMINIMDDILTVDKKWLEDFSRKYSAKINRPNFCFTHPKFVDKDIVGMLERMGTVAVNMGVQVISPEIRNKILNRDETNRQIAAAIQLFRNSPIFLYVDMLLDVPGQDEIELIDTARFLNVFRPDAVSLCWLNYYPKFKINLFRGLAGKKRPCDRKKEGRLGLLIMMSAFIPGWLLERIINKKLYGLFPVLSKEYYRTYTVNFVFSCVISFWKTIFKKKRNTALYAFRRTFRHYFYFLIKGFNGAG